MGGGWMKINSAYESDAVFEEFFVGGNYFFSVYEAHQYIKPLSFNLVEQTGA